MRKDVKEMIDKLPAELLDLDYWHMASMLEGYAHDIYELDPEPENCIKYLTLIKHLADEMLYIKKKIIKETK